MKPRRSSTPALLSLAGLCIVGLVYWCSEVLWQPTQDAGRPSASAGAPVGDSARHSGQPVPPLTRTATDPTAVDDNGAISAAQASARLWIRVEDQVGRRVREAEIVVATHANISVDMVAAPRALTDEHGRVAIEVPIDGVGFVAARNERGRSSFKRFAMTTLSEPEEVVLRLLEDDVSVAGQVIDEKGLGVPGAQIKIWQSMALSSDPSQLGRDEAVDWREAIADADGRFEVRLCRDRRPYVARARGLDRSSRLEKLHLESGHASETLTIALPGHAVLEGVVLDWKGRPAADCAVFVGKASGRDSNVALRTDPSGRFVAHFFSGGDCLVIPIGNDIVAGGEPVEVVIGDSGVAHVTATTLESAELKGRVLNISAGDKLRVMAAPRDQNRCHLREADVDPSTGRFRLGGLVRGWSYDVFLFDGEDQICSALGQAGVAEILLDKKSRPGR